jgi:hypothetical protein
MPTKKLVRTAREKSSISGKTRVRKTRVRKTRVRKSKLRKLKLRKTRKTRKIRGGNNIGANCSEPNFSIYNTNMLKLFPYKGGNLKLDDQYKNNEGPQY